MLLRMDNVISIGEKTKALLHLAIEKYKGKIVIKIKENT